MRPRRARHELWGRRVLTLGRRAADLCPWSPGGPSPRPPRVWPVRVGIDASMSELYLYLLRTLALCVDSAASRTHRRPSTRTSLRNVDSRVHSMFNL